MQIYRSIFVRGLLVSQKSRVIVLFRLRCINVVGWSFSNGPAPAPSKICLARVARAIWVCEDRKPNSGESKTERSSCASQMVTGSIPNLYLSFAFSSLNCTNVAFLVMKNGISKNKKALLKFKGHHLGSNRQMLDHKSKVLPVSYCGRERRWARDGFLFAEFRSLDKSIFFD